MGASLIFDLEAAVASVVCGGLNFRGGLHDVIQKRSPIRHRWSDVCRSDVCRWDVCRSDVSRSDICRSDVCHLDVYQPAVRLILVGHLSVGRLSSGRLSTCCQANPKTLGQFTQKGLYVSHRPKSSDISSFACLSWLGGNWKLSF